LQHLLRCMLHYYYYYYYWLYDFYSPNNIRVIKTKRMACAGHMVRMGKKRNAYRILVKKNLKRPLGRPRHRWG
jgi:hypothetical protein